MASDELIAKGRAIPKRTLVAMLCLGLGLACVGAGQSMVFVVVPLAAREMGFSPTQIGFIFAFSAVFWLLTSQFWGGLSDRWGRRKVFAIGMVGYAVSLLLFSTALSFGPMFATGSILLLAMMSMARSLNGILGSASRPAAMGYIADITDISSRVTYLARMESGFTIGTLIGPVLGAALLAYSLSMPFIFFACTAVVFAVFAWFAIGRKNDRLAEARRATVEVENPLGNTKSNSTDISVPKLRFTDSTMRPFLIVAAIQGLIHATMMQTLGLFFFDVVGISQSSVFTIGVAFTIASACSIFSQWLIVDRYSSSPQMLAKVSILGCTLVWFGMSLATTVWEIYMWMGVNGLCFGLLRAANSSIMSLTVSQKVQGRAQGMLGSVAPIGHVFTPVLTMPLYALNPHYPYILSFTALAGVALLIYTSKRFKVPTKEASSEKEL